MKSLFLAGLGNPGRSYSANRHNLGFMIVDAIADKYGSSFAAPSRSLSASLAFVVLEEYQIKLGLIKPNVYMNNSGLSIMKVMQKYRFPPEDLYVVYDEADLDFAVIKIKIGGGSGGHNGIRSIDENIGKNYWRVRVGIGKPKSGEGELSNYVLQDFDQTPNLRELISCTVNNLGMIFQEDKSRFLTRYKQDYQKRINPLQKPTSTDDQ